MGDGGGPAANPPHPDRSGHAHLGAGAHQHAAPPTDARGVKNLTAALVLILAFLVAEVIVGIAASSLALISDAAHMLTDAAAIALALFAGRLAARPAKGNLTYGLKRIEILSAQANGVTLWLLAVWFVYEGIQRLREPGEVAGGLVLGTALVGIMVNLVAVWLVARADRRSLNVEGAFQHMLNDLFAFVATAVAGVIVLTTGWMAADAVAALIVAALMIKAGWGLLRDSWRIFLEAAPRGIDVADIDRDLHTVPGVLEVHDLHVWEVTSGFPALSAHILVDRTHDCHERRTAIAALLHERYGLEHVTLQIDHRNDTFVASDALRQRLTDAGPPIDPVH